MSDEPKTVTYKVGMFNKHPEWKPAAFNLPDNPDTEVWVTNAYASDAPYACRQYGQLHPEAMYSVGAAKGESFEHAMKLQALGIVGIYARKKQDG